MELREFIEARLAEAEAGAQAAGGDEWSRDPFGLNEREVLGADGRTIVYDEGAPSLAEAEHIAIHGPARLLRDVASNRKLLELADYLMGWSAEHVSSVTEPEIKSMRFAGREILRQLVTRWSDHPDYDRAWSPGNVTPRV